ncbi:SEC-C metal-binding domain-containing protein [Ruminococcus sp. HUN007]|uniref:IS1096 element passenger TnpR family protein n=1 Tax=Ruminococcus sp. HUN007 TaxID=1514668 RepID=UPI0005D21959|nr:SEC-C metal-binding domain-containing protein [Ruminococcus sp. HUN007]
MTFAILKIIRKGEKPPVWRRIRVPIEITFAQLAVILEKVLEIKETDKYQFDFLRKYRMMEITDETVYENSYYYTYLNSPDTFINNYLECKKRFTFRISGNTDLPEYTVDVEKFEVYESKDENHIFTPQILKWTVVPDDRYWARDSKDINSEMETEFGLSYGEKVCSTFSQITGNIRSGSGIILSNDTEDITDKRKASGSELLYETAKTLEKFINSKQQKQSSGYPSMSEILSHFSDNSLKYYTEDFKFNFDFSNRVSSLEKFCKLLLKPEIIKLNLTLLKPESFDLIEKCINDPDIFDKTNPEMCKLVELGYFFISTDNKIFPSKEFSEIYTNYISESYRDYHSKVYWIRNCLFAFQWCYSVAPLKIMYGMYCTNNSFTHDKDEFTEILSDMTRLMSTGITIQNDYIIANGVLKNKTYEKIIKKYSEIEWTIINENEIRELFEHLYPYKSDAYKMLRTFLKKESDFDDEKIEDTCIKIYQLAAAGMDSIGIIPVYLSEIGVLKNTKRYNNLFLPILDKIVLNTRMPEFKGHTPDEATAELTKMNRELKKQIISNLDNLYGAAPVNHMLKDPFLTFSGELASTVKTSPNSPCPCGSGKKYKKCCGLK